MALISLMMPDGKNSFLKEIKAMTRMILDYVIFTALKIAIEKHWAYVKQWKIKIFLLNY